MGNEEKILQMLEEMKAAQEEMKAAQEEMKTAQEEMRNDIAEMQTTLTRVAVTQENMVLPQLQLLFEGQQNLRETLAPKERVEVLEEEMITLKSTVKAMAKRLAALEKAQ